MFIRFITNEIDNDSQKRLGVFQAINKIKNNNELADFELGRVKDIMEWFSNNLKKPLKFTDQRVVTLKIKQ